MNKLDFIKQCRENRKILGFTYFDMSACLFNVSEEQYKLFENGKCWMSEENLRRIVRVLCIEHKKEFYLEDYVDVTGLSEEEVMDIKGIVETLVGEVDA